MGALLGQGWRPGLPAPGAEPPPAMFMAPRREQLLQAQARTDLPDPGVTRAAASDDFEDELQTIPG